ncbi:MAG: hypothetical protein J6Y25_04710 [Elusimicrobiaceae bacterium]|nr:hypothetical protein [Elusimicrobiaceae bacterium]
MKIMPCEEKIEDVAFALFKEKRRQKGQKADFSSWARLCQQGRENYRAEARVAIETWEDIREVKV